MELKHRNFGYSLKNIPTTNKNTYLKTMISKLEHFIKRLRWKAFFFDQNLDETADNCETFGFKSEKSPPQHDDLIAFENDLYKMIKNIKFTNRKNAFQRHLSEDIKKIGQSPNLFIPADKTTNIYEVSIDSYKKLLKENVTASYKNTNASTLNYINLEAKSIAQDLKLDDRIESFPPRDAFITLKDHKESFQSHPKCRLINPAKSELGKISKAHLDKINSALRLSTGFNQWRNTSAVLNWFKSIPNKANCKFLKFDVVEFYPSISEKLLNDALSFARTMVEIDEDTLKIITHARMSLLFCEGNPWVKKSGAQFDVTMGSFDGAEVCELVGIFLLHQLSSILEKNEVGLYRDDGLAILRNASGPYADSVRKKLIKIFHKNSLKVTVETNLYQTDFLDVSLNLKTGRFWPYRKPNSHPLYINAHSNHPPTITRELPKMISKRIAQTLCDEEEYLRAMPTYAKALQQCGYRPDTTDFETLNSKSSNSRRRKVTWFNPPFHNQVSTNIGKVFLRLIGKHFPVSHRLHKLFNRNTIKLSYSCLPNMENIISAHNKKLLNCTANTNEPQITTPGCNCRKKAACPLSGKCLSKGIIYEATVANNNETKKYFGLCATDFKSRFNNHVQSFKHKSKAKATELSKYVWACKDAGENPDISWKAISHAAPYKHGGRNCNLCLTEKFIILTAASSSTLNKRTEILNKCRHKAKFKLKNLNVSDPLL